MVEVVALLVLWYSKKMRYRNWIIGLCAALALLFLWGIFVPRSFSSSQVIYTAQKGEGYHDVATDLQRKGIIHSRYFFDAYAIMTDSFRHLQAGSYLLSPSMSVAELVYRFSAGQVVKNTVTIVPGWDLQDLGTYLENNPLYFVSGNTLVQEPLT